MAGPRMPIRLDPHTQGGARGIKVVEEELSSFGPPACDPSPDRRPDVVTAFVRSPTRFDLVARFCTGALSASRRMARFWYLQIL